MPRNKTATSGVPHAGSWKLLKMYIELQDTHEKHAQQWNGRMIIQPDGKFIFLMTMAGRTAPLTEVDRATAFTTQSAGAGCFEIESTKSYVTYELASNPQRIGTFPTQLTLVDGQLHITTNWWPSALFANRIMRTITTWARE
jgi:hypothetical protein